MKSEYDRRRNFKRTPEPGFGEDDERDTGRRFVIQQHDATRMHYDFRLQVGGVLASWAVPRGLSTDPRVRRLAIRTEDHPLGYADFEGVIPEGEYGAGPVLIWDRGTFENLTDKDGETLPLDQALEAGHAVVRLHGQKLGGGYTLQRIERDANRENWLIIKVRDEGADARRNPVSTEPRSVTSGRTIDEIENDD